MRWVSTFGAEPNGRGSARPGAGRAGRNPLERDEARSSGTAVPPFPAPKRRACLCGLSRVDAFCWGDGSANVGRFERLRFEERRRQPMVVGAMIAIRASAPGCLHKPTLATDNGPEQRRHHQGRRMVGRSIEQSIGESVVRRRQRQLFIEGEMVQLAGLEPATFGATIRRSSQLSYSCT